MVAHGNGSAGGSQGQVATGDSVQVVSSNFQGGFYGQNAIDIGTTSQVQRTLVSPSTIINFSFPSIQFLPYSTPGTSGSLPPAVLNPPMHFG